MGNVYSRLGVKTFINAYGTVTKYSGSLMLPETTKAMIEASKHYVELNELQNKAGSRIAELLGVEAAYITTGAAAGIVLSVAACIAGDNPAHIRKIPNTDGLKNEVIILKSHFCHYKQQVRQGGGRIVEVGQSKHSYEWELEEAISDKTAAMIYFVESENVLGSLPLSSMIEIAQKHEIPVLVDAAAEIPPVENLTKYLEMGAALVQFSGGKDIRGPQSSGFIIGRKDLIQACALNANPNSAIGRPFKADKETIIGLLTAVELYLEQDFDKEMETWREQTNYIKESLSSLPGITAEIGLGIAPGIMPMCVPRTYITWDPKEYNLTKKQLVNELKHGEPGILVSTFPRNGIDINPHMLDSGQEIIVVERVREILSKYRKNSSE